jgi:squalene-associated FAD-dependent desaturase
MRVVVIGGGLAGISAAIELADAGHEVMLFEARPTLGGKVQTLPERDGDPEPPPDNGQHIALGCFDAYLDFLQRIGSSKDVDRRPLELTVIDERGRRATIGYGLGPLLRYRHIGFVDRLRILRLLARLPRLRVRPGETFGAFLRRHGQSEAAIERFWDVFIRPGLNLRTDDVDAEAGWFTVVRALRSGRAASDLVLPTAPLGEIHGAAARRALEGAGAEIKTDARVDDLRELAADGIVLALPPEESGRLLGEEWEYEYSPIVSVHLLFATKILRPAMASLLGSHAHWVFDRGRLTGHEPERGQYLTVVSSGAPELLEVRGRELVELISREVTDRLGKAEVLWSRVSREPEATIAFRPGLARPGVVRDEVVLAGAWLAAPWPPTMEAAVRSGRDAASMLSGVTTKVAV